MRFPLAALALTVAASTTPAAQTDPASMTPETPTATDIDVLERSRANPLLAEWAGPYGGVPAFDRMDLADLEPAVEAGIAAHLAEIEAIAQNPAAPTFDNTIVAMEKAGRPIDRAFTYYGIWSSNLSSPEFREVQGRLTPRLSAYQTAITQNATLFDRVKTVHDARQSLGLRPEQLRLVELVYDGFARNGATLEGEAADRYAAIDRRLAELYTEFGNRVLADEEAYVTYVTADQLPGLPASFVAAASAAAEQRGRPGEYAVTNTRSSMDPFLTYSDERDLREAVWRTVLQPGRQRRRQRHERADY